MSEHASCEKCNGEGWLWWYELDDYDGPGLTTGTDDTRYICDACGGESRMTPAPHEPEPGGDT